MITEHYDTALARRMREVGDELAAITKRRRVLFDRRTKLYQEATDRGWSQKEMAELTGVSVESVMQALWRARQKSDAA
jgi:hypothetical protein